MFKLADILHEHFKFERKLIPILGTMNFYISCVINFFNLLVTWNIHKILISVCIGIAIMNISFYFPLLICVNRLPYIFQNAIDIDVIHQLLSKD